MIRSPSFPILLYPAFMSYIPIPLVDFTKSFASTIGTHFFFPFLLLLALILFDHKELSSVALSGRVLSVSDEFFAKAYQLLLVEVLAFFDSLLSSFIICHSLPRAIAANSAQTAQYTAVGKVDDTIQPTIGESVLL
jgi:hypothetical protein